MHDLALPLTFTPVYHTLVWGGRRMARWRKDLPDGPIGESWDLADHQRGMSVVDAGPLAGRTLSELTRGHGKALVGEGWDGGEFPLLVKLIDAADRLSIQVHPDDELAVKLKIGTRGKTECWLIVADGGELYVGLRPGVTRESFEAARQAGRVAECLVRHEVKDGDFAFLPARTVHALGKGSLIYEVQQTCDTTFRVDDWGRLGLDGKPRPLHVAESLATIDFTGAANGGLAHPAFHPHPAGGSVRALASCAYFSVEERRARQTSGGGNGACSIITCLHGSGTLATAAGAVKLSPWRTALVPAAAGAWSAQGDGGELRLMVSQPG